MTTNPAHTTDPQTTTPREGVRDEREVARPDLKAPPSSPEPDHDELARGLDKLESVKPY